MFTEEIVYGVDLCEMTDITVENVICENAYDIEEN